METLPKIDVESEKLTTLEAVAKVEIELERLKLQGENVAIIIHGYGSKGVGGEIKKAVLDKLKLLKKHKKIADFYPSEKFSFTCKKYNFYTKKYPNLLLNEQTKNLNFGVTIVFL